MKKIILLGAFFAQASSWSCSYIIQESKISSKLAKIVAVSVQSFQSEVQNVKQDQFKYKEVNTTGMCPDAIIYNAEYEVDFKRNNFGGYEDCIGVVEVEMFSPWGSSTDKRTKYSISEFKNVTCN